MILARHIANAANNGRIEMSHNIRHNDSDDSRGVLEQTHCKRIGTIIPLSGQLLYSFTHLLPYLGAIFQCP